MLTAAVVDVAEELAGVDAHGDERPPCVARLVLRAARVAQPPPVARDDQARVPEAVVGDCAGDRRGGQEMPLMATRISWLAAEQRRG